MKRNIIKILLNNKRVNNYTKLLLYLNTLDYFGDNYIPNKKLINKLNITKKWVIILLNQLEKDNIINIYYKGNKRYFNFIEKEEKGENQYNNEIFDYNWLED